MFIPLKNISLWADEHTLAPKERKSIIIVDQGWTAADYFEHLCNLERYKKGSGITVEYDFITDARNRVLIVDVLVHYPAKEGNPDKNHTFHWIVRYK